MLCLLSCDQLFASLWAITRRLSVHGILQARILEWVAISSSRGSSRFRNRTCISCIVRGIFYHWATWEPLGWIVVKAIPANTCSFWIWHRVALLNHSLCNHSHGRDELGLGGVEKPGAGARALMVSENTARGPVWANKWSPLFPFAFALHLTFACPAAAAAGKSLQSCPTLCDPTDGSPIAPLSIGFSRQEHWSGLPFPSPMLESEMWKWSCSVVSDS